MSNDNTPTNVYETLGAVSWLADDTAGLLERLESNLHDPYTVKVLLAEIKHHNNRIKELVPLKGV